MLYVPKVRIDVVIGDTQQSKIVEAIRGAAAMGRIGDGKIFVSPIDHAIRIRTGEIDEAAL